METTKNSLFSRLMSIVFIAMGIFLGIYAFFANATTWTVGAITWDNSNYLTWSFRDQNPTDYDIVTALYGTGNEGSIYTSGRDWYDVNTCLASTIHVEYPSDLTSNPINAYTIYVVAPWTYDIDHEIVLQNCSAIISSGIVVLSGNGLWTSSLMRATNTNNIILQNIRIDSNIDQSNGLSLEWGKNITIKDFQSYENSYADSYGLSLSWVSYINIIDTELYDNYNGLFGQNFTTNSFVYLDNAHIFNNNECWIYGSFYRSLFTWIISYHNEYGVMLLNTNRTTIDHIETYNNNTYGFAIHNSSNNTFTYINAHDNTGNNIYLYNISGSTLEASIANNSAQNVWLYISTSSGNTFSGISANGNYYAWVHFYNSNNNTSTNITTNNNTGEWLTLSSASWNCFYTLSAISNNSNGISVSNSHNNRFLYNTISSWNALKGIIVSNSSNTMIDGVHIDYNNNWWIQFSTWENNLLRTATISYNTWWIACEVTNMSWFVLDDVGISNNFGYYSALFLDSVKNSTINYLGIWNNSGYDYNIRMNNVTYSSIISSTITGTWEQNWIYISGGYSNIISGTTIVSWANNSMEISNSNANTIINSTGDSWLTIFNSTWTNVSMTDMFAIWETNQSWLFLYTTYDVYTQNNNHISLESFNSNIALITGNTIPIGPTFNTYFDDLHLEKNTFPIPNNFITLFTYGWLLVSWSAWDGNIYLPTPITAWSKLAESWETWTENITHFFDTIEVISGDTYLTFINVPFTNIWNGLIHYRIAWWTSGQELKIVKSIDGNTWTTNILSECILDEDLICEFDFIDNFKLFAFWVPTNLSFTGYTLENETITSGWIYNTGVYIHFTGDYISGATLNWSPYTSWTYITTDGTYIFILTDEGNNSTGITFTIDTTNPLVTGNYPTSGLHISGINNIPFSRTGWDNIAIDTYTLSITGTQIYTWTTTANTSTVYLPNGSYTRHIIANDRAGNTWSSQTFPFIITAPYTGNIILTWPNTIYIWTQRFTKDWAGIYMLANDPTQYTISWAIDTPPLTWTFTSRMIHHVLLTGANGAKDIFVTMDNGSWGIISKTLLVQLDTVAPIPTLTSPINGTNIAGTITLNRSAGPDAAGLSWYQYLISPTDTFGTIFHSWSTTTSSVTIPNGTISYTGTLYRKVIFIDKLGNTWSSTTQSFNYTGGAADTIPSSFHFNDVTNADLDEIYASNTITITGMTPNTPVLASINRWALYISGHMVGVTGYVQNGRTVKIELNSSYKYDTSVESTLTIGWVSDTFKVTTKKWTSASTEDYEDIETDLSNTQKLMVIAIFETLKDLYGGDKEEEFFNTMLLMLDEKMDEYDDTDDEYIALKYLYDLIEQYYDDGEFWGDIIDLAKRIINGIYTAPNEKKYRITYDSSTKRFTSTNFVVPKYFPTLDTLKYIIDINNPAWSQYINAKPILARWKNANIDGTRQTSPYTAPNKKVFYFFKDITGKYSSYTFTSERYFNSLNEVKEFIYNSNKK